MHIDAKSQHAADLRAGRRRRIDLERNKIYVIGAPVAPARLSAFGRRDEVSNLDEIIDRAIEYTNLILQRMPSYRDAAISGLRTLRHSLAARSPADPAVRKLDDYLDTLRRPQQNELR